MSSLLELDLSGNLLHGSLPRELGQLRVSLCLTSETMRSHKASLEHFTTWPHLQDLLLSNNPLGGNLMGIEWGRLAKLSTLDLSNTNMSGGIPESFVSMKMLRFLALDNNILSGCVPAKLADLPALTALYLNGNNLTGEPKFSEEFYRRMGRRFAVGRNQSNMDRTSTVLLTSLGFPTCSITVWLGVAVQQLLGAILFVFLL